MHISTTIIRREYFETLHLVYNEEEDKIDQGWLFKVVASNLKIEIEEVAKALDSYNY